MSEDRATALRREFDSSFQQEPTSARAAREDLLVIRLGDELYGLRLAQVEGVVRDKKITHLPGAPSELLGIAGFRGLLVAAYDLATWLGLSRGDPRWLALVAAPGKSKIALAFDSLEKQLRLDPAELVKSDLSGHVDSLVQTSEGSLRVLSIPSLVARVSDRSPV